MPKMKKNRLPPDRLDIITPVLSHKLHLTELPAIVKSEKQKTKLYLITKKTPIVAREATENHCLLFSQRIRV